MSIHDMPCRITFQPLYVNRVHVILSNICLEYEVTMKDLKGKSRRQPLANVRMIAYARLRAATELSYPAIGRIMGGKHHATVIHGERKARALLNSGDNTWKI